MRNPTKKMSVTAVLHEDTGQITAFLNDMPGLLVQGDSNDDVKAKLKSLTESYIKKFDSIKDNIEIQMFCLL